MKAEIQIVGDEVAVKHFQKGVDALLWTQPAGEKDFDDPRVARWTCLRGENRFGERVHDANVADIDAQEPSPEFGAEPAGGDQCSTAGVVRHAAPLAVPQRRRDVQHLEGRVPGADGGKLRDEHDDPVEVADLGNGVQRAKRDVRELIASVGDPGSNRDDLRGDAASIQLSDLTDRVVLRAARPCR